MNKKHRSEKWAQRHNSAQIRKYIDKWENSFVNDLELIEERQEYDSYLKIDPKKCMECP